MTKKIFSLTLGALLLALCFPAKAQQANKVPRIGDLSPGDAASEPTRSEAIRLALWELGYVEGQNIGSWEVRGADSFKVVVKKNFVGVVAEKQWQAVRAASKLKVAWTPGAGLPSQANFYEYLRKQKPARDTLMVASPKDS